MKSDQLMPRTHASMLMVLCLMTLGSVQATDLRIYPNFSEVRQPVQASTQTLEVRLPQEAWQGIVAGSVDLEGLPFSLMQQSQEDNWLSTLEGKKVFLKRGEAAAVQVTLIRAKDLLVQDEQGRFFNVRYDELQFSEQPPLQATTPSRSMRFVLPKAGEGTLSYLTRSVRWTPRYTLKADDKTASLSALADIQNNSSLPYEIKKTELYAGEVGISTDYGQARGGMYDAAPAAPAMMKAEAAPSIQSEGEFQGLYRYALNTAFSLPANSVITLPFLQPKISQFERYVTLSSYFGTETRKGNMSRAYRFQADQPLPAGAVTVREQGRMVGQQRLEDTRQGGDIELVLGSDPDVVYQRSVQTIKQEKNREGNIVRSTYKVTYEIQNAKDRPVKAELTEQVGSRIVVIDSGKPTENGRAQFKLAVPAKGKITQSFNVTIE